MHSVFKNVCENLVMYSWFLDVMRTGHVSGLVPDSKLMTTLAFKIAKGLFGRWYLHVRCHFWNSYFKLEILFCGLFERVRSCCTKQWKVAVQTLFVIQGFVS